MVSGGGVFGRRLGFDEVEGGALLNGNQCPHESQGEPPKWEAAPTDLLALEGLRFLLCFLPCEETMKSRHNSTILINVENDTVAPQYPQVDLCGYQRARVLEFAMQHGWSRAAILKQGGGSFLSRVMGEQERSLDP